MQHLILDIKSPHTTGLTIFWKMNNILTQHGFNIIKTEAYEFDNSAITAVWLLSESHASIHTWPETGLVCLDIFCCSKSIDLREVVNTIKDVFDASEVKSCMIDRG